MKKIIAFMLLLCLVAGSGMAQDAYYLYKGERQPLTINTEFAYLLLNGVESPAALQALSDGAEVTKWGAYDAPNTLTPIAEAEFAAPATHWAEIRLSGPLMDKNSYQQALKALSQKPGVALASPYYQDAINAKMGLSELFVVRLGDPQSGLEQLMAFASKTKTQIIGRNNFMANWYTLGVTENSQGNALEMANLFAEQSFVTAAQPDLMTDDDLNCTNDPLFNTQWALENTGQNGGTAGIDLNACDGWSNWTTGDPDIIVAILDHGFEQDHPDLAANNVAPGFDTESGTTPALVLGRHGTACAGIAGAVQDNNEGVSGVCPDCGLMSISNSLFGNPNSRQRRADGINWAWQNGAVVVSNSWGSGVQYQVIDDAVDSALTHGRGGLGTLIAFSAGNSNSGVAYPANSNPDILCVGAMSPCGERKNPSSCDGEFWGSNFGTELDIMAPGVIVQTTDQQGSAGYASGNYAPRFNGTSAACPHVAGLVGLILSVNPCLDHRQVADIIEATAQKVGTYTYSTTTGRPNGTWNNEMGYGLIDLDAAMEMATELRLQNETINTDKDYFSRRIYAGSNVDPNKTSGPFIIDSPANVTFTATAFISLEAGFSVNLGASFSAVVDAKGNCGSSKMAAAGQNQTASSGRLETAAPAEPVAPSSPSFTLYPNPFSNSLNLDLNIEQQEAMVDVRMYNLQGQEVAVLMAGKLIPTGNHKLQLDLNRELPKGIYMVKVCIGTECHIQKLIRE